MTERDQARYTDHDLMIRCNTLLEILQRDFTEYKRDSQRALDDHRKESDEALDAHKMEYDKAKTDHERRIRVLERWYLIGMGAFLAMQIILRILKIL